jgi:phosphatidate phosphatase PAH1
MRAFLILILLGISGCVALKNPPVPPLSAAMKQTVIFDIDGTLTPTTSAIFGVRQDAASAVKYFADQHYQIVYLSARPLILQKTLPKWLETNKFPQGLLYLPQSDEEAKDPIVFKTKVLQAFTAQGWSLAYAFGDSTTDFVAYAQAGIAKSHVYALQHREADACQEGDWQACLTGWSEIESAISKP